MRPIVVSTLVTLDGVMEAPGGEPSHPHTGWAGDHMTKAEEEHKFREVQEAESLLLGRVTYESFAGAWPNYEGPFADRMNAMAKHVVSSTLHAPEWNNTSVISGDIFGEIEVLRNGEGGPILVNGSKSLVHSLFERGMVDELRLMIFPVILGSGFRLYPESADKISLRMVESVRFASGVVENRYQVL